MLYSKYWPIFLQHCQRKGLSQNTLKAYQQDAQAIHNQSPRELTLVQMDKEFIEAWISSMQESGSVQSTVKRRIAFLKIFMRWLELDSYIAENPFHKMQLQIRIPKKLPKNIRSDDLQQLLNNDPIANGGGFSRRCQKKRRFDHIVEIP